MSDRVQLSRGLLSFWRAELCNVAPNSSGFLRGFTVSLLCLEPLGTQDRDGRLVAQLTLTLTGQRIGVSVSGVVIRMTEMDRAGRVEGLVRHSEQSFCWKGLWKCQCGPRIRA